MKESPSRQRNNDMKIIFRRCDPQWIAPRLCSLLLVHGLGFTLTFSLGINGLKAADSDFVIPPPINDVRVPRARAVASDGKDFLIVFGNSQPGQSTETLTARIVRADRTQGGNIILTNTIASTASVTCNGKDYLIVWHHNQTNVLAAMVSTNGVLSSKGIFPVCSFVSEKWEPQVASDGTNFFVAWMDYRHQPAGQYNLRAIYGTIIRGDGTIVHSDGLRLDADANSKGNLSLASDGTSYLAAWSEFKSGSSALLDIVVSGNGSILVPPTTLKTGESLQARASARQSNYHLTWLDFQNGSTLYLTSRVKTDGTLETPDGSLLAQTPFSFGIPIMLELRGRPLLIRQHVPSHGSYRLHARLGNMDGAFTLAERPISDASEYAYFVSAAANRDGQALVLWNCGNYSFQNCEASAWIAVASGNAPPPPKLILSVNSSPYGIGGDPIRLDPAVQFQATPESVLAASILKIEFVENATIGDHLQLTSLIAGPNQLRIVNNTIHYNNVTVGSFTAGTGLPLTIEFNSQATREAIELLSRGIVYFNSSATPRIATRRIRIQFTDGVGQSQSTLLEVPMYWGHSPGFNFSMVDQYQFHGVQALLSDGTDFLLLRALDGTVHRRFIKVDGSMTLEIEVGQGEEAHAAWNGERYLIVRRNALRLEGMFLSKSGTAGNSFLISQTSFAKELPRVSAAGTNFFVTWLEKRQSGEGFSIYGTQVSGAGTVSSPGGFEVDAAVSAKVGLHSASDGNNHLIVWADARAGIPGIYTAMISQTGTISQAARRISPDTGIQLRPQAIVYSGGFLVGWEEVRIGDGPYIYGTRLKPDGSNLDLNGIPLHSEKEVGALAFGLFAHQNRPMLALIGTRSPGVTTSGDYGIYLKRGELDGAFSGMGQALPGPISILRPAFGAGSDGKALLLWTCYPFGGTCLSGGGWVTLDQPAASTSAAVRFYGGAAGGFSPGGPPLLLDSRAIIQADNSASLTNGRLKIEVLINSSTGDLLTVVPTIQGTNQVSISGQRLSFNGTEIATIAASGGFSWIIQFNSAATHSGIEAILRSLTFQNNDPTPRTEARTLRLQWFDAEGRSGAPALYVIYFAPRISNEPPITLVNLGGALVLDPTLTGSSGLIGQWRQNGVVLTPATNAQALRFTAIQLQNGGTYTLAVQNSGGALTSDPMIVLINAPEQQGADDFAQRSALPSSTNGLIRGANHLASIEPSEPMHADKSGGRSVWHTWRAPSSGIATFKTTGSTFDTLLAVYRGTALTSLIEVAGDEDSGAVQEMRPFTLTDRGGFLTSKVRFTATEGENYQIAIDGLNGAEGHYILSWDLEQTSNALPIIIEHPKSQTVAQGSPFSLQVQAQGAGLQYQWFFRSNLIANANGPTLVLPAVTTNDVGAYFVQIRNNQNLIVQSLPAYLEIVPFNQIRIPLSFDKFEDLLAQIEPPVNRMSLRHHPLAVAAPGFVSVAAGASSTRLFSNFDSTTQLGEPHHCHRLGGASQWFGFRPESDGLLRIDTSGSSVDTVLGIYSGTNLLGLKEIACDDNSAADRKGSLLFLPVQRNVVYLAAVDGVGAARGLLKINWLLLPQIANTLALNVITNTGSLGIDLSGYSLSPTYLEASADFLLWTRIATNPFPVATFELVAPMSPPYQFFRLRRFQR